MVAEYIEINYDVSAFVISKSGLNENDDIMFDPIIDKIEWEHALSVAGLSETFLEVLRRHCSIERNGYWVHNILTKRGILEVTDIHAIHDIDWFEKYKVKLHIIRDGNNIRLQRMVLII